MSLEFPFTAFNGINKSDLKKVTSALACDKKANRVPGMIEKERNGGRVVRVCYQCHKEMSIEEPVGRRDTCAGCGADARCCLNCAFYDVRVAAACREPQADLVQHKDAANFCEFFALKSTQPSQARPSEGDARAQLDALFKKKS